MRAARCLHVALVVLAQKCPPRSLFLNLHSKVIKVWCVAWSLIVQGEES